MHLHIIVKCESLFVDCAVIMSIIRGIEITRYDVRESYDLPAFESSTFPVGRH